MGFEAETFQICPLGQLPDKGERGGMMAWRFYLGSLSYYDFEDGEMKRLNVCTERDLLPADSTANPVLVWFCVPLLLLLLLV